MEDEKNVDRSFFSVAVNSEDLENRKEAGRETQGAQGVSKELYREWVSFARLMRDFRNEYH